MKYPEDFALQQGVLPKKFTYFNHQIYTVGTNGKMYLWDSRVSIGFKEEVFTDGQLFSDVHVGRGFYILVKPFMVPENSRLLCDTSNPVTYEPITCSVEVGTL